MKKFILYKRHATSTDLFPVQNVSKRSHGSLSQIIKRWGVRPTTLPFTRRHPVGKKKLKQVQLKCLAKRKHSENKVVKFSPTLQDGRYPVTASILPQHLPEHSENTWRKCMVFHRGCLGGRKRFLHEGRCRKLSAFFPPVLQHTLSSTANIAATVPTESSPAKAVLNYG